MSEFQPGDMIEVALPEGLAYVQLTHSHPSYPPVVQVFDGRYRKRPDVQRLATKQPKFIAMVPLAGILAQAGLKHEVVANVELTEAQRDFPTFRMPIRDRQGEVVYWWFWDGRGLSYSAELTSRQSTLPIREVMPARVFLSRAFDMEMAEASAKQQ